MPRKPGLSKSATSSHRTPRLFGKAGSSAPAPKPEPVVPAQIPCRPLRVLLAEDQKINQRLAMLLLHQANHHVDLAENGEQAVAAMQRADYDIVLMDVQMPVLDGCRRQSRYVPSHHPGALFRSSR
jgi:PleD family two-component response regulator